LGRSSQLAMMAAGMCRRGQGRSRRQDDGLGPTQDEIATQFGVSPRLLRACVFVRRSGREDLIRAVMDGEMAAVTAASLAVSDVEVREFVYFCSGKTTGLIKIGWTFDPVRRVKDIQRMSPDRLQMIGFIPGSRELEKMIHEYLSKFRVHNEWFDPQPPVVSLIQDLLDDYRNDGGE
jgi:hypothetical protein